MSAALALVTFAAVAAASPQRALSRSAVIIEKPVPQPGVYAVTVLVRGRTRLRNRIEVVIGDIRRQAITDHRHRRVTVRVRLTLAGTSLRVWARGGRRRPLLKVSYRRLVLPAAKPTTAPVTTTTTTPTPTTSGATTAAAPTTTPTTPAAPAGPPGPTSPYTNLVWSDDFTQNWASEGGTGNATEYVPGSWNWDSYGGCGSSPGVPVSYPATQGSAYLSSGGLVIPVTGQYSYTTAQLDTRNISGESWTYGTIEASIKLPVGPGLCPAFWMWGDNNPVEIDIVEAPALNGATVAPYAIGTLHADNTQQYERSDAPAGWNPAAANVYGVEWTPTSITWTLNYVPYASATASDLANPALWSMFQTNKLHLMLDEGVGGWPGAPPSGTTYSQPMVVQWVKVFQ